MVSVLEHSTVASPYLASTSWTFSNTHSGGGAGLLVVVAGQINTGTVSATGMTFNGVAADEFFSANFTSYPTFVWAIGFWSDPGAVTANVVTTFSANVRQALAAVFELSGAAGLGSSATAASTVWVTSIATNLSAEEVGSLVVELVTSHNDTTYPAIASPATQIGTAVNTAASKNLRSAYGTHETTTTDAVEYSGTCASSYANILLVEILAASVEDSISAEGAEVEYTFADASFVTPETVVVDSAAVTFSMRSVSFCDCMGGDEGTVAYTFSDATISAVVIDILDAAAGTMVWHPSPVHYIVQHALASGQQETDPDYTVVLSGPRNDIFAEE